MLQEQTAASEQICAQAKTHVLGQIQPMPEAIRGKWDALELSATINGVLATVDRILHSAQQKIDALFDNLEPSLAAWAAGEKAKFQERFVGLRADAHKKAAELQTDLRDHAVKSVLDARQKIQQLRDENKSLREQIAEARDEFLKDPAKWIINGILKLLSIPPHAFWAVVARIQQVVADIAKEPRRFANNLVKALGQGFKQFFGNIGTHLLQGLIT